MDQPTTLVRARSHRSRERVERIHPDVQWLNSFRDDGSFAHVPAEVAEQVLAVPSVTRGKPKGELFVPWRSSSLGA